MYIKDGEAALIKKIFEAKAVNKVIIEALKRDLTFYTLAIERVTRDGLWKSTEESTVPAAILYLQSKRGFDHLIVKRPEDKNYGLWEYRWTP